MCLGRVACENGIIQSILSFKSKLKSGITMFNFDFDFELRLKNMGEKTQENQIMGYSTAYPTDAERILIL